MVKLVNDKIIEIGECNVILTQSAKAGERWSFGWQQIISVVNQGEAVQIANGEAVLFRIDRPIHVKSPSFVTTGGQDKRSQYTQRHTNSNTKFKFQLTF